MNLRIGNVKNYNNEILISSPSFKIGTNVKINLDEDEPDVKPKKEPDIKSNKEQKKDVKTIRTKPDTEFNKEPDMNEITHEEEKVALILGMTSIFTVWWMFK